MRRSLQDHLVPALRARGFTGSLPHFRRIRPHQIDLLSVQFDKYGGGFCVELAKCEPQGVTTAWGAKIPPEKVKSSNVLARFRLGSDPAAQQFDHWFRYDGGQAPDEVAVLVVRLLASQADAVWDDRPCPTTVPATQEETSPVPKRSWWRFWPSRRSGG